MKRLFFLLVLGLSLALPQHLMAQTGNAFFDRYSGQDGFTAINITPKMFELIAAMSIDAEDPEAQAILEMIESIEGLNVLIYEGGGNASPRSLFQEARKSVPSGNFEELMTVQGDEEQVHILVEDGKPGYIKQLVLMVDDQDEFVFLTLRGNIELAQIAKLAKMADGMGLDALENLEGVGQ